MPNKSTIPASLSLSGDFTIRRGDSIALGNMKEGMSLAQQNTRLWRTALLAAVDTGLRRGLQPCRRREDNK